MVRAMTRAWIRVGGLAGAIVALMGLASALLEAQTPRASPGLRVQQSRGCPVNPGTTPPSKTYIPYSEADPILRALREDLWPAELRAKASGLDALWSAWVGRRDAEIRGRVVQGEEESVIHLLLFGTMFTTQPLATERTRAALGFGPAEALGSLRARIEDFIAAVQSPGTNERLQFARQVIEGKGIDPATEAGKSQMRQYLEEGARKMGSAALKWREALLNDRGADSLERRTLFSDRGLTFNSSLFINAAVEQTLEMLKANGVVNAGSVRRIAIIGPGLEFTENQEGYDFYPPQTIQPFAILDSAIRLGLSSPSDVRLAALDVSPRVIEHLEAARTRARAGGSYPVALARNRDRVWTPASVRFWDRFGDRIGEETKAVLPPPRAGHVDVRSVLVRPSVVLSMVPCDVNIVVQRLDPLPPADQFDLIVATNILVYYGVFEQSLAVANIAKMLRPGGFFLSNDRIFELPASPVREVGLTDVRYTTSPGIGDTGDRIIWYQRQ
jgi:hypothetical protein